MTEKLLTSQNLDLLLPGTGVSVGVFSHILKIDDAIVGIYSSMSKILASFVYGFAKTSLVFYLGKLWCTF